MSNEVQKIMSLFGDKDTKHLKHGRITVVNTDEQSGVYVDHNRVAFTTKDGDLYIDNNNDFSQFMRTTLNCLPGVDIQTNGIAWYLNGVEWNGHTKLIGEYDKLINGGTT